MKDPSLSPINLEDVLLQFRQRLTTALVKEAKKQNCSVTQFETLQYIGEHGSVSMKNIAIRLHITPPSASTLIDTLVAKKLVARESSQQDRRTVSVVLTPRAHVLLSSIYQQKNSIFKKMLTKLNATDTQTLARILSKCI